MEPNATYNRVVLAAHRSSGAGVSATDTDNIVRAAVQTKDDVQVLQHDVEQTEDDLARGGLGLQ